MMSLLRGPVQAALWHIQPLGCLGSGYRCNAFSLNHRSVCEFCRAGLPALDLYFNTFVL